MDRALWWNKNRLRCALPASLLAGGLVWIAARGLVRLPTDSVSRFMSTEVDGHSHKSGIQTEAQQAAEEASSAHTPPAIAEILRKDPRGSNAEDRGCVWEFLRQLWGDAFKRDADWLLGADEALNWLRGATQAGPEVEVGLVELATNSLRPNALREYAMQHLGIWAEEHAAGPRVLEAFHRTIVEETALPLSGVALLALTRSRFSQQERAWIHDQALHLAGITSANVLTRTAALQVAGQLGFVEAEPSARKAFKEAGTVNERIIALQVLGWVGSRDTLNWLAAVGEDSEPMVCVAQRQALRLLRTRWERLPSNP